MASEFQNGKPLAPKKCPAGLSDEAQKHNHPNNGLCVECLYCKVSWQLKILVVLIPDRAVTLRHFAAIEELVAALPLTSGEFAVAQNRLSHAAQY